jgi:hypothetical protein
VVAQTVGLHDQPQIWPVEVDFPAVDELFAEWEWEARFDGNRAKEDLQLRVGEAKRALVEEPAQQRRSRLPLVALKRDSQLFGIDQVALVRLVDRSLHRDLVGFGCQIDKRSRHAGHWNPVAGPDVLRR